jgi:hypothetical protein
MVFCSVSKKNITGIMAAVLFMIFALFMPAFVCPQNIPDADYAALLDSPNAVIQSGIDSRVPAPLAGVWENASRLLDFYTVSDGDNTRTVGGIFLKMFYGRYYDRTAEPAGISAETVRVQAETVSVPPRPKNNTSAREGEVLVTSFEETSLQTETSGSWLMHIRYPPYRESDVIPLAVIDDKLYLDFYIRYDENPGVAGSVRGFWRAAGTASGITASRPYYAKNIESLFITDDAMYRIRYWEADVIPDFSVRAYFSAGADEYAVDKYIAAGNKIFTCVPGRGTRIRQVGISPLPSGYVLSQNGSLCAFAQPYLVKSAVTDVYDTVERINSLPPHSAPAVFPPSNLNFYYDVIEDLRKYTPNLHNP